MEYTVVYKEMEITFGELANALKYFKFKNKSTSERFIYINEKFDAIVLLPMKDNFAIVNKTDIASISFILSQKGVFKHEHDLAKWIEQKRLAQRQASR